MSLIEKFRSELFEKFATDDDAIYIGEDVRNAHRGIAIGLHQKFGDQRIIDMPISESAFTGIALGVAIAGKTIFVEYNFAGLLYLGLDQIFNQAHKYNEMMNTNIPLKIVYILPTGTRGGLAGHHSDNPYPLLSHLGINSYLLATKYDCEKVFEEINNSQKPCALFLPVQSFWNSEIPEVSISNNWFGFYKMIEGLKINLICTGTTYQLIRDVIKEEQFEEPNIYILTDLLFSKKTISSIKSVPNLPTIFIDDSFERCGICSEIQKFIKPELFLKPISRISSNIPFSKKLEDEILVSKKRIVQRLSEVMK